MIHIKFEVENVNFSVIVKIGSFIEKRGINMKEKRIDQLLSLWGMDTTVNQKRKYSFGYDGH